MGKLARLKPLLDAAVRAIRSPARRWMRRGAAVAAAGGAIWALALLVNVSELLDLFRDDPVPETTARTEARVAALDAKIDAITELLARPGAGPVERGAVREAVAALIKASESEREAAAARLEAGDVRGAEAALRALLDAQAAAIADQGETWLQLGAVTYARDAKAAVEAYRKADELLPEDWRPPFMLGLIHLDASRDAAAERAFMTARDRGHPDEPERFEAAVLGNLGIAAHRQQKMRTARALFEASLEIHRRIGARREVAANLSNLAALEESIGAYDAACAIWGEARDLYAELGDARSGDMDIIMAEMTCERVDGRWRAVDPPFRGYPWPNEG